MNIIDLSMFSSDTISNFPIYINNNRLYAIQFDINNLRQNFMAYDIQRGLFNRIELIHDNYYPVHLSSGMIYLYLEKQTIDYDLIGIYRVSDINYETKKYFELSITKNKGYKTIEDIFDVVQILLLTDDHLSNCISPSFIQLHSILSFYY